MKEVILFCFWLTSLLLFNTDLFAQKASVYSASTGTTASLATDRNGNAISFTTAPNLIPHNTTFEISERLAIGFDVWFMGNLYTHLIANGHGAVGLCTSSTDLSVMVGSGNALAKPVTYPPDGYNKLPVLAAFWDFLQSPSAGPTVQTAITGTAPNRCRIIQWNTLIAWNSTTTGASDGVFQVRIYEFSGEIEYVYGRMTTGPGSEAVTASIGFNGGAADDQFMAIRNLTDFSVTTTVSQEPFTRSLVNSAAPGPIAGLNSNADGSRRYIRFLPPALDGNFSNFYIDGVTTSTMKLNWTDNFINELGYCVYSSTDNFNFSLVAKLPPNSNEYQAGNLNNNTRYYWKVIAFTEGAGRSSFVMDATTHCSMQGTYSIGPAGDFTSIGQAFDSLTLKGATGSIIFELQNSYTSAGETFPLVLTNNIPCRTTNYQITIRPAANATAVELVNSTTQPLLILDGISNIFIDGRPGGTGNTKALTLSSKGTVVLLKNASGNTLSYINSRSGTTGPQAGAIVLEGDNGAGSDNNIITNCDLADYLNPARVLVRSVAINGTDNRNNQVTNCSLRDFSVMAIYLARGSKAWTIKDNSFYHTRLITVDSTQGGMVVIRDSGTLVKNIIEGNWFGGTAPQASGNVMAIPALYYELISIQGAADVRNNRFRRLQFRDNLNGSVSNQYMVRLNAGPDAINTYEIENNISGNIFGGKQAEDSISCSYVIGGDSYGTTVIETSGFYKTVIENNLLQHIRMKSTSYSSSSLKLIDGMSHRIAVKDNVIKDIANDAKEETIGISINSYEIEVVRNTISNIKGSYFVKGILCLGNGNDAILNVSGNIISHLHLAFGGPNSHTDVTGMDAMGTYRECVIKKNEVYGLASKEVPGGSVSVRGIISSMTAYNSGTVMVSGNSVHSLQGIGANIIALSFAGGNTQADNNLIRLGVDSLGKRVVNRYGSTWAIWKENYHSDLTILHNTIQITTEGDQVDSTGNYIAMVANGGFLLFNNIISVNRPTLHTNRLFSTDHYILADNNIYYLQGKGVIMGSVNLHPFAQHFNTLDDWRMGSGRDQHSIFADPHFVNAEGPASTINLRPASPTPAEGKGNTEYIVGNDYEGKTRSNLTPVDIGAYAANYTFLDKWAPLLTPDSIPSHHRDSVQRITVKISDDTGLDTAGNNKPVMWFKRFFPDPGDWHKVQGTFRTGNLKQGTWSFVVDYAAAGLTLTSTDSIECYFVAKDTADSRNTGFAPIRNANHTDVYVQNGYPTETYHYKITGPVADTLRVGVGQTYPSLTGNLGAFQALNHGITNKNGTVILITSDLVETGENALENYPAGGGAGVLRIVTNTPVVKNIVMANKDRPLITIKSSRNVILDGSIGGTGRYLFLNNAMYANERNSTIYLKENNRNILVRNTIIESIDRALWVGENDSAVVIRNNIIRGATNNPNSQPLMNTGILAQFKTNALKIVGNEVYDFSANGIFVSNPGDSVLIDSNHVYMPNSTDMKGGRMYGICVNQSYLTEYQTDAGHIISNNYIGGTMPYCGGAPWLHAKVADISPVAMNFIAISVKSSPTRKSYIYNNTIRNINITTSLRVYFLGIVFGGMMDIEGNTIGDPNKENSIATAATGSTSPLGMLQVAGICSDNDGGSNIINNTIANISSSTTAPASVMGIYLMYRDNGATNIRGNTILNLSSNGSLDYTDKYSMAGIWLEGNGKPALITNNAISGLKSNGTADNKKAGGIVINTYAKENTGITILRNRISDIENKSVQGGAIYGIALGQGSMRVENNQVSLTNGGNSNSIRMAGMLFHAIPQYTQQPAGIFYNTVFIGGAANTGNDSSWAVLFSGRQATGWFVNNLLYNKRTGGTGLHPALGVNSENIATNWDPAASNHNFIVSADTAKAVQWNGGNAISMKAYRAVSNGDAASFSSTVSHVPAELLFNNINTGDLNINISNSESWYVNGKGIPVAAISDDYDAVGVRSVQISNGPSDIGSNEFTPQVDAPELEVYGKHIPGGTDTLSLNGRIVATINWENTGTLPVLGVPRWFSGVWPNDVTNNGTADNARYMSGYWHIPATGGSGYKYSITFHFDSSMLGKIKEAGTMLINKRQTGVSGSWKAVDPTVVDLTGKKITITGQTEFSEFTATDLTATLQSGVFLPNLGIVNAGMSSPVVNTGASATAHFTVANMGKKEAAEQTVQLYLSRDAKLNKGVNGDLLLTEHLISSVIPAKTNSAVQQRSFTIPCSVQPGYYQLLIVSDGKEQIEEGDETNNITAVPLEVEGWKLNILQADTVICAGSSITLTATGADSYAWYPAPGLSTVNGNMVIATPQSDTKYTVSGTKNNCTLSDSVTIRIKRTGDCVTTSVVEIEGLQDLKIAPNPGDGRLVVSLQLNLVRDINFTVYTHTGTPVYQYATRNRSGSLTVPIDLRSNAAGMYYLQIAIGKKSITKKILIIR